MNRRLFGKLLGGVGVLSPLTHRGQSATSLPSGIAEVTHNKLVLTEPPDRHVLGRLRYALSFPFQADRHMIGVMVMRMVEETANYGFLDGSDIILLDELNPSGRQHVFAASRNEIERGQAGAPPRLFMKSPLIGGFVPRGALRANGAAHPHAGTGFGVGQAHWFPFAGDRFNWGDAERKDMNEVYQLTYDGQTLASRRTDVRPQNADDPLRIGDTGWSILVTGIRTAIPDGDDLLFATLAARLDRTAVGVGVIRWTRQSGDWKPLGFDPVVITNGPVPQGPNAMERCPWQEPSLVRDADDSLLFSARGADSPRPLGYTLRVWRSARSGQWRQVLDQPKARLNSPVTVNVAANGAAYLVSNPYDPAFIPETPRTGRGREKLVVWPLSEDRASIESPLLIRDCLAEFGTPPSTSGDQKWMADHPNGLTVRLNDGWHHILCYRICHSPPYRSLGTPPSPHSGSYIEEVRSRGPARPIWRFADDR